MDSAQTPGGAAARPEGGAGALCPRCSTKLINPDSLGWCPKCGYCKSIEQDAAKVAPLETATDTPAKPSPLGIQEFIDLVRKTPPWLRVLFAGVLVVLGISVVADYVLKPESFRRALWSTLELILGMATMFIAQLWALALLAPRDDKLGPRDAIVPFRLWSLALNQLPSTRKQVWMGAWGLTAGLCAVLVVGGLDFWIQYYNPPKVKKELAAAAEGLGENKEDLKKAVEDMANTQSLTKDKKKDKEKPDKVDTRPTAQCLIIGYRPGDAKDTIAELLVASFRQDEFRYAGRVRAGLEGEKIKEEVLPELKKHSRAEPLPRFKTLNVPGDVIWLDARLFCEVHNDGYTTEGQLLAPRFKKLLRTD